MKQSVQVKHRLRHVLTRLLRPILIKSTYHLLRPVPRGLDYVEDIARFLPDTEIHVVFDVGANVGQSAKDYLTRFPAAQVYSFEPVSETFRQLKANLRGLERVRCYQIALGSSEGTGTMILQGSSDRNFLNEPHSGRDQGPIALDTERLTNTATQEVSITTLDQFCHDHGVSRISFLKIDTEGADLEVLKGGASLLKSQAIDLVEVEAGISPLNERHVPFEAIKRFLEGYGYCVFGIYQQISEWPTKRAHLRRINPVFISRQVIERNCVADS